jgi:hypothetical protein
VGALLRDATRTSAETPGASGKNPALPANEACVDARRFAQCEGNLNSCVPSRDGTMGSTGADVGSEEITRE